MSEAQYSIGVFDDHPIITDSLNSIFEGDDFFCIKLISNKKEELFDKLKSISLDVLILDVIAPNINGLELFTSIGSNYPHIKIVAYTTLTSPILIENLLASGANAYINKRQKLTEVKAAILQVCEGKKYVPDQFSFLLKKREAKNKSVHLSRREQEILNLILDGKISKEIADMLFISKNTVENHRSNLFKKFQVKNLAELFKQAIRLGYSQD